MNGSMKLLPVVRRMLECQVLNSEDTLCQSSFFQLVQDILPDHNTDKFTRVQELDDTKNVLILD
jgi:hypothetical protein